MNVRIPQYILFDLDGTLLHSLPGIVFSVNRACHAAGLPQPVIDLRTLLGPPIRTILSQAVQIHDPTLLNQLEAAFRLSYDSEGWQKTSCFPGVPELLEALRAAGHRLFVASNKPRHISLKSLNHLALLPFFELVYTLDSRTPSYASKAEMLEAILAAHSVSPADCLMIGDTMDDIAAAAACRIPAAFVEHGYGNLPADVPVFLRLRSFSEFLACLTVENAK